MNFFSDITGGGLLDLGIGLINDSRNRKMQKAAMRQAQAQFDSQMDETIQRRISDAKKAGIHPLFALGASANISPTISAGGPGNASAGYRGSARPSSDLLKSQVAVNEAQAALLNANRAKVEQDLASTGRDQGAIAEITTPMLRKRRTFFPEEIKGSPQLWTRVWDNRDKKHIWTINPDLGLDEVGQVAALREWARQSVIKRGRDTIEWTGDTFEKAREMLRFPETRAWLRKNAPELYRRLTGE